MKECFLNYVYKRTLSLHNNTAYPAKYELVPQDEFTLSSFTLTSETPIGMIEPFSTAVIPLDISIERIGIISSTMFVKIVGNGSEPLSFDINALGVGPEVVISSNELNWGSVTVLKSVPLTFSLSNTSPVPAYYSCETISETSVFSCFPLAGIIEPGMAIDVTVTAFLDDTVKFTDIVKVSVQQTLKCHEIALVARGQGTTVVFDESLKNVDFGDVFSNYKCEAEFLLTNKGRRPQTITWVKEDLGKSSLARLQDPIFEVVPNRFLLKAGAQQAIVITGTSSKAADVKEKLICQAILDKDPTRKVVAEAMVNVNFVNPIVQFSPQLLKFKSIQTTEAQSPIISKTVHMKNVTPLPLTISLRCPAPFSIKSSELSICLQAAEIFVFEIFFDPNYNQSRTCCQEHAKLTITYKEHSQKDTLELFSEVSYPNLRFSTKEVDFGCVQSDLEHIKEFQIRNKSPLVAQYKWLFVENSLSDKSIAIPNDHVAQAFDIQPTHGFLQPGESETVSVIYYGDSSHNYNIHALCDVLGGPKYDVVLKGQSSRISFKIDKALLDFGQVPYQSVASQEIEILNDGLVQFDFDIAIIPQSCLLSKLVIYPATGTIKPKESQKITVRFCGALPEVVQDFFSITVAYLEPQVIHVKAEAIFPSLEIDLPFKTDPLDEILKNNGAYQGLSTNEAKCLLLKEQTRSCAVHEKIEIKQEVQKLNCVGLGSLYPKQKGRMSEDRLSDPSKVIHKQYICDFGTVIKNNTTRRKFMFKNIGHMPISFSLDKDHLESTGFSIELEKVKALPVGECIEFIASFLGKLSLNVKVDIPISIVGGPMIILCLMVTVSLPELNISDRKLLNFDEVHTGYRKTIFTQIQNVSDVACDWSARPIEVWEGRRSKKPILAGAEYSVSPKNGTLAPMETVSLMVKFLPEESKTFEAFLPIRVQLSNKNYGFRLTGKGIMPEIAFTPAKISAGPVFPCGEGMDCKIMVENLSKLPLEFYSVDFDQQYLDEEEILRNVDSYTNGVLCMPPKRLGIPLIEHIHECRLFSRGGPSEDVCTPEVASKVHKCASSLSQVSQTPSHTEQNSIIVIHGPPFSGRTTQAKKLAAFYEKGYLNLDEAIESHFPEFRKDIKALKDDQEQKDEIKINEESVCELIRFKVNKSSPQGLIIDGFDSKYFSSQSSAAKTVMRAISDKSRKLVVFNFIMDLSKIHEREGIMAKQAEQRELEALFVSELEEESYDSLSDLDRIKYDKAIYKYRKRLKEIEEDKRRQRSRHEEGVNAKLGGAKGDEDKAKKRLKLPGAGKAEKSNLAAIKDTKKPGKAGVTKTADKSGEATSRPVDDENILKLLEEPFLDERNQKRTESYVLTLEAVLSCLKDSEKAIVQVKPLTTTVDKKTKMPKQVAQELNSTTGLEESHTEDSFVDIHDINCNMATEDVILKKISEFIPILVKQEEALAAVSPDVQLDQIIHFPATRLHNSPNKSFILGQNDSADRLKSITDLQYFLGLSNSPGVTPPTKLQDQKPDLKKTNKPGTKVDERPAELEEEIEKESTHRYRWILQPEEKKELTIKYSPSEVGKVDTMLKFEVCGSSKVYEVACSGKCQYNHIVTDPKKIFTKWKKSLDDKTSPTGYFTISNSTYDFGPLLSYKNKEKDSEKYAENRAVLNMMNPSQVELKIEFALKNDIKGEIFTFEPPVMDLLPGQTLPLTIFSYPKVTNHFEDTMIVCVKDNPEPYFFKVACTGVKPDVELDKKLINFEKTLLGRIERREIKMKNISLLPISWEIAGLDTLGDEFKIPISSGKIESGGEFNLAVEFQGFKSVVIKRVIRLEISDSERIAAPVHDIPIIINAEAYDISIDIHFPKGTEGGLDFGTLKVLEEGKQICTLKNRGKYEVGYRFLFDKTSIAENFTITPGHGILQPSEKSFPVQVLFKSDKELAMKEDSCLRCVVFEPATGEITATLPFKITASAVFSKYSVLPVRDLNFGALVHGTKVTKQFVIDNTGEFDFKYNIFKFIKVVEVRNVVKHHRSFKSLGKSGRAASPPPATKIVNKREMVTGKQPDQVTYGAFTVYPPSGTVPANSKLPITVDFHTEVPGLFEEIIGVDISDRSPAEGDPLEYRLVGETCVPGINTTDYAAIFEEHLICKRLELFNSQTSVYAEEDRVFFFGAYLAGQQIQAHFKIMNPFKIPCDVVFSTKSRGKGKGESSEFAFDVEPKRLTIPSHEYRYVTVSFHPTTIQSYVGIFEAMVENVTEGKNRLLTFELRGEGTLPRVVVEKPSAKYKNGSWWLKFRKLLVGTSQTAAIFLRNDGIVPAKFKLDWTVKDTDEIECNMTHVYHTLKPQETRAIEVRLRPVSVRKLEAELRLKIADNTFEDSVIQITGEGYLDDLTFEGLAEDSDNEIIFTDCTIGGAKYYTFRLLNHSLDTLRIAFTEIGDFTFTPSVLHIAGKAEHEVTVAFSPKQPVDIQRLAIVIKASRILLAQPVSQDWNDRMKAVKWVCVEPGSTQTKKVVEILLEPHFDLISNLSDYSMILSGFADYCKYEADTQTVAFKSTLMFQTRVFRFPIRNLGKVSMKFRFTICEESGVELEYSPFSIEPDQGAIAPDETAIFMIRFSPLDVSDYKCLIHCDIPNLSKEQESFRIAVKGSSVRPFCHFELEDNDYILAERRASEHSTPSDAPLVLEPNTKALVFNSCGVRGKNMKRFYIVNPTHLNYEFSWKPEPGQECGVFKCLTPKGMVASDKKTEIVFEFNPESINVKVY